MDPLDGADGPSEPRPGASLRELRAIDDATNLGFLAVEFVCLAATIGLAAWFVEGRAGWGLPRAVVVPVVLAAIVVVGAIQHRLAGLGHEASHYTLVRNRWWNDLLGDVFCFLPIFGTLHFYRLFHLAHHQYTNDPDLDPDLVNLGPGKRVDELPTTRLRFVLGWLLGPITAPRAFARYQWEYIHVNALGKGDNVYMRRSAGGDAGSPRPRPATVLGGLYLIAAIVVQNVLIRTGRAGWLVPLGALAVAAAAAVVYALPARWGFRSPLRQPYSERFAAVLRIGSYTALLAALGLAYEATGGRSTKYFVLLWLVPTVTTFPYFRLLRDVYQHTNADSGRLTNSRVFFCDPFTRWAVFVHGQDMHVPHHLHPTVPHYRLPRLHRFLQQTDPAYARDVVECHGTFANPRGLPTILDVLTHHH